MSLVNIGHRWLDRFVDFIHVIENNVKDTGTLRLLLPYASLAIILSRETYCFLEDRPRFV